METIDDTVSGTNEPSNDYVWVNDEYNLSVSRINGTITFSGNLSLSTRYKVLTAPWENQSKIVAINDLFGVVAVHEYDFKNIEESLKAQIQTNLQNKGLLGILDSYLTKRGFVEIRY